MTQDEERKDVLQNPSAVRGMFCFHLTRDFFGSGCVRVLGPTRLDRVYLYFRFLVLRIMLSGALGLFNFTSYPLFAQNFSRCRQDVNFWVFLSRYNGGD